MLLERVRKLLKINKVNQIKQELKTAGTLGIPMCLRLFLFLVVLVITMILGVIVILLLTGIFSAGLNETEKLVHKELNHIFEDVSEQYGQLSVQAVEFSKDLSTSIERKLHDKGLNVSELENHPEILEELLRSEYERSLFLLQKSKSSGVFIILNTTVNKKLENAANSRAGLFIKNMEPNILSSSTPTILLLRGFPNIGRENSIHLHAQWNMEFDITDAPYYHLPIEQALKQKLPLSRLYFWTPALTLPGTSDEIMLCSVPLIDSQGTVFGVCGFEISAMLFKLAQMPDNNIYTRMFCIFAPLAKDSLDTSGAMFSGGYSTRKNSLNSQLLSIGENKKTFYTYKEEKGNTFLGFHLPVNLYPEDSAFSEEKWALALMIPKEDIKVSLGHTNLHLALMFTLLTILGIIISFVLSNRYTKPITNGLDIIKSADLSEVGKTKIPEIDEIIEFLSLHYDELNKKTDEELPSTVNDFIERIKTLSPAERAVFNLYVQEYTAKEIAGKLCLSINTIKTHNKRIYAKLNVSSREELLVYINMLKEAGKEIK